MANTQNSGFGLFLGALGCAAIGATVALAFGSSEPTPIATASGDLTQQLDGLVVRIESLEGAAQSPTPAIGPEPHRREPAVQVDLSTLEERLAKLEAAVDWLQQNRPPAERTVPKPAKAEDPIAHAQKLDRHRQAILSSTTDEQAKVDAWSQLRFEKDSWTDAVVQQMVHIGLSSSDPEIRANVWRQADGRSRSDLLVPALLQAVQHDTSTDAREEAAETLVGYHDRPHVIATIRSLLLTEQEEGIRRYFEEAIRDANRTGR